MSTFEVRTCDHCGKEQTHPFGGWFTLTGPQPGPEDSIATFTKPGKLSGRADFCSVRCLLRFVRAVKKGERKMGGSITIGGETTHALGGGRE